ncbi:MAG: type II secretion system F family protein, partial [Gemmataceae bacterium]|nr:type II secretion system F family protein [Gemmataceae bacterium]
MPTYKYEAMDTSGGEVKDSIDATNEEEAQQKIRQMGYFVTKITEMQSGKKGKKKAGKRKKGQVFTIGGVSSKLLCTFTRQFSTLQDAGLPILRSLRILEGQMKPGVLKNALIDVVDDVESGSTLSEAFGKHPRCFDRLYVNMVKAGEAGGALEVILKRLADFKEKAQSLQRRITGAMIYPVVVVLVAVSILTFIMIYIIPKFEKIFKDFNMDLPDITRALIATSQWVSKYWYVLPLFPLAFWLLIKLIRLSKTGNYAVDRTMLYVPIVGGLIEKTIVAQTTRTLGTLVASGVPILEA